MAFILNDKLILSRWDLNNAETTYLSDLEVILFAGMKLHKKILKKHVIKKYERLYMQIIHLDFGLISNLCQHNENNFQVLFKFQHNSLRD